MYTMFPASVESRASVKKEPLRSRIQSAMEEHPRLFYLAALAGALTAVLLAVLGCTCAVYLPYCWILGI